MGASGARRIGNRNMVEGRGSRVGSGEGREEVESGERKALRKALGSDRIGSGWEIGVLLG